MIMLVFEFILLLLFAAVLGTCHHPVSGLKTNTSPFGEGCCIDQINVILCR